MIASALMGGGVDPTGSAAFGSTIGAAAGPLVGAGTAAAKTAMMTRRNSSTLRVRA
ncbi:MAG TPA: hypothetical protein VGF39_03650 [Stellaceae bacterium]